MNRYYYDAYGQLTDASQSVGYTYTEPPAEPPALGKAYAFTGPAWVAVDRQDPATLPQPGVVDTRPVLVITSVTADAPISVAPDLSDCTMAMGTTVTISAELRAADGTVIPMTDAFRMPMRKRGGGEGMLLAKMVDGVVTVAASMTNQGDDGVWEVTEDTINANMPAQMRMSFAGFRVNIYR